MIKCSNSKCNSTSFRKLMETPKLKSVQCNVCQTIFPIYNPSTVTSTINPIANNKMVYGDTLASRTAVADAAARKKDDEDRRRRQNEEDDDDRRRRNSESSSSSYDYTSSSNDTFGGGSSDGGGSSSEF